MYIDGKHAIAHNKIMLVDNEIVITGSFNFTQRAEDANAENLPIVEGKPGVAAAYQRNFNDHLKHADQYVGPVQPTEQEEEQPEADLAPPAKPTQTPAAQSASPKMPLPPGAESVVHVTRSGKRYHREGCESLARSDIPMKLPEAQAKGYTPCSRCNPPK